MKLKTKLVLLITGLVFLVISTLSWLYLGQLLQVYINQSYTTTTEAAHQVLFATRQAIDSGLRERTFNVNDPAAVRAAVADSLRTNPGLNALINSIIDYSPTVLDVSIADSHGRALLSAPNAALNDQMLPRRENYGSLRGQTLWQTLHTIFGPPQVYNVSAGLDLSGKPFLTVRIGVRTTFLKNSFRPWLVEALWLFALGMITSLAVAAFVANLALAPIETISRRLDLLEQTQGEESGGEMAAESSGAMPARRMAGSDAVAQVSGKIERLGQRMRNVEEVFTALKENLDQVLSKLQDGMILFTRDSRAILVSSAVERFVGRHRDELLGADVREIFDRETRLGRLVRDSFEAGMSIVQEEVTTETGRQVQVSLDFIHDGQGREEHSFGALLTLHDLESMQELESELELSRRMASIGRLTAGVGHEVKNPINAIVVHLELLRNKVELKEPEQKHLDIIQSEIHRLDRVVQTLVDFSRPVELNMREHDLRQIVQQVLTLASVELEGRGVTLTSSLPEFPVTVKVDADLTTQALLNVVINGGQAMPDGGLLDVRLTEDGRWATIRVRDEGTGIPPEVLPRIFDLYYTTKKDGSGIGLAMTYRILQFQNGRVDVESDSGGTEFSLCLPLQGVSDPTARGELASESSWNEGTGA
uniref:histidine kinase n=1 Tax=Acidobacterium capsulatum TaxID=33075 RepID=A0A7V4XTJ8_9BACT